MVLLRIFAIMTMLFTGLITVARADSGFSPAQRAEIDTMIRAYILEHPEILPEAIGRLQAREQAGRLSVLQQRLTPDAATAVVGNPKGDVTLVEFMDFRCSYCRRSSADVKKLVESDPNLRVVFKQFPILDAPGTSLSRDLARAAMAAGRQGKYYPFHTALYTTSKRIENQAGIEKLAADLGLDLNQFRKDMADPAIVQAIDANIELGQYLGINGTPYYVVGDQVLEGAHGYDSMKKAVAEARAKLKG